MANPIAQLVSMSSRSPGYSDNTRIRRAVVNLIGARPGDSQHPQPDTNMVDSQPRKVIKTATTGLELRVIDGDSRRSGIISSDMVADWDVSLSDGNHRIQFEHGTTSGKRVIRVDGREVKREDWMFKLVGRENFEIGKAKACIAIEAVSGFAYEYSLEINGKPLKKFRENQSKIMKTWTPEVQGKHCRVVLEKDTLNVWVNSSIVDTTGEFTDEGTETHFVVNGQEAYILAKSSGKRRDGIVHTLFVNDTEIQPAVE